MHSEKAVIGTKRSHYITVHTKMIYPKKAMLFVRNTENEEEMQV